jgi:hypothetical protein
MDEERPSSLNYGQVINLALALITLAGGAFLVSRKLSSVRPGSSQTELTPGLTEQNIDSRLWEDPFAAWGKLDREGQKSRLTKGLRDLQRCVEKAKSGNTNALLILGVMVSGQPYAEAQEQRIRARFAVSSALGVSGYDPEEEHIGVAATHWPSKQDLEQWARRTNAEVRLGKTVDGSTNNSVADGAACATSDTLELRIPFEFFRAQAFGRPPQTRRSERVMVLWLEEEAFEDLPLARLALVIGETGGSGPYCFIGPRHSSTLQAMLRESEAPSTRSSRGVKTKLGAAKLVLATATAMDEALLRAGVDLDARDFEKARWPVIKRLKQAGFNSVVNFACLDSQLACEALNELELRQIFPWNPTHHLVLVSEWDSFYSRAAAAAIGAELSRRRAKVTRLDWIESYVTNRNVWPPNVHRMVYLRGLDGETAQGADKSESRSQDEKQKRPKTLEEMQSWVPEANRAEGSSQFDYLTRLGTQVAALNEELWRTHRARVRAVGILGSDIYDALLVARALRERVPEAVFFTTDLDARLWHPRELEWSRNLIAISGYGLQLAPELQQGIAPFRDASSSATYAAALHALGVMLTHAPLEIPPRRFEISRQGPVDLSTQPSREIHAQAAWEKPRQVPPATVLVPWVAATIIFISLMLWLVTPVYRRLTDHHKWVVAPLIYGWEDVGGPSGARALCLSLAKHALNGDELAKFLCPAPAQTIHSEVTNAGGTEFMSSTASRLYQEVIERLNLLLFPHAPDLSLQDVKAVPPEMIRNTSLFLPQEREYLLTDAAEMEERIRLHPETVARRRAAIDAFLDRVQSGEPGANRSAFDAARSARAASNNISRHRTGRLLQLIAGIAFTAAAFLVCGVIAWAQTLSPGGEPLALSGVSAWPGEFIRLIVLIFCVGACFRLQSGLREATCDITRRYRLPWVNERRSKRERIWWSFPEQSLGSSDVNASGLWGQFQEARHIRQRGARVTVQVALYMLFAGCLFFLAGTPSSPVRGGLLFAIDKALLFASVISLLFLTFWTVDSARLTVWFTRRLCTGDTTYPDETLAHFARKWAIEDRSLLDEWIDMQLIADLTERAGRLIYFPFIAMLLMLLARSPWWDRWSWPWPLLVIIGLNLGFAAASSIVLRKSAKRARQTSIQNLSEKVNAARRNAVPVAEQHSSQAQRLLDEIKNLRRGAFAPLSESPLLGAILLNSSGAVLIQLAAIAFAK